MDDPDDPIKKLFEQTGWSYQDVLKKLEKYKNFIPANADSQLEHLLSKHSVQNEIDLLPSINSKPTNIEIVESKPKDELNTPNGEEATKGEDWNEGSTEVDNDRCNGLESIFRNDDNTNTETEIEGVIEYNQNNISSEDMHENTNLENSVDGIECLEENNYYSIEDSGDEQPLVIDLEEKDNNERLSETASDDTEVQDDITVAQVHQNLLNIKKIIYYSRRCLQPTKLIIANNDGWNIQQVLWARIPSASLACKWRVIYMNLKFAYLSLLRSSYTIKYDDVMKAVKLAQTEKITIVLKSDELQKNYHHSSFGIYCVHNYWDKIFVGPYFPQENHDLDTLSFINGVLVNTELLNQINRKNTPGSGLWFHQVTNSKDKSIDDDVIFIQDSPEMIDLTSDSDDELLGEVAKPPSPKQMALLEHRLSPNQNHNKEEIAKVTKFSNDLLKTGQLNVNKATISNVVSTSQSQPVPTVNSAASKLAECLNRDRIYCHSGYDDDDEMVVEKISESDPNCSKQISDAIKIDKKGVLYNMDEPKRKYILTNIPTMGYIVTYHYENYVDAISPISQKVTRFHTAKIAVTAVERALSKRFILIPSTFKLQCRLVESVEDNVGPLDRTILNRCHIAGAFGVKNIFACTVSVVRDLGMDKNELKQTLVHHQLKLLLPQISDLAKLLKIPMTAEPLTECLSNILEGARKEIDILQKERDSFANEKLSLETRKNLLTERYFRLIAALSPEQQSKVQEEFDPIFSFNPEKESVSTLLDVSDKSDSSSLDVISNEEDSQFAMDYLIQLLDDSDEADTKIPRVGCSTMPTVITVSASSSTTVQSIATSSVSSVSSTISKSKLVNTMQTTRLPITSMPLELENVINSSMVTITPVPRSVPTSSTFPKASSDYIAINEENNTSDKDYLRAKPLQSVKRSGSSVVAHLSAKKNVNKNIFAYEL